VHEILRNLPAGARVLDLGSSSGSFDPAIYPVTVFALDEERPTQSRPSLFVQADAARLPFSAGAFDAIIANHTLEHFTELDHALQEIARVLKVKGKVYIAVPDSTTLTDRLYRWLAQGGGHVNAFRSLDDLKRAITQAIPQPLAVVRPLHTSLSFLNRKNRRSRAPRRLWLLGGGEETVLVSLTYWLRLLDRMLHTRLSIYGWALFLGEYDFPVSSEGWTNVCVRCGSGHSAAWLEQQDAIQKGRWFARWWFCPSCGARNRFTRDSTMRR
jgi:SAM-dependent methyltransferase